jgi:hypothetical protein
MLTAMEAYAKQGKTGLVPSPRAVELIFGRWKKVWNLSMHVAGATAIFGLPSFRVQIKVAKHFRAERNTRMIAVMSVTK